MNSDNYCFQRCEYREGVYCEFYGKRLSWDNSAKKYVRVGECSEPKMQEGTDG